MTVKNLKKWGFVLIKLSLLLFTLILLLVLIGSTLIYTNQDKIYQMAISELNQNKQGFTTIGQIKVSPFKSFPYVSVDLNEVVVRESEFSTDTVVYVRDLYVGFDLWAVMQGQWDVKNLTLEGGCLFALKDSAGSWNIARAFSLVDTLQNQDNVKETSLNLELSKLKIRNFDVIEHNIPGNKYLKISINDLQTRIQLKQSNLIMKLNSDFFLHEYASSGLTFFKDKNVKWVSDITQKEDHQWTIESGFIGLDEGNLDFEGSLSTLGDWWIDLSLAGQKNNFNLFLNFLPNDLFLNLKRYRNQGKVFFKGTVKGPLLEGSPALYFELGCTETSFVNLKNNASLDDIAFVGIFSTGDSNSLQSTFFELKQLYAVANKGTMKGTFRVEDLSNPRFKMQFKADLRVEDLLAFYDTDLVEQASGKLKIDLNFSEFVDSDSLLHVVSKLRNNERSFIEIEDFSVRVKEMNQAFTNASARLSWADDEVFLDSFRVNIGASALQLKGQLSQFNALVHGYDVPVVCKLEAKSKLLNFNELGLDSSVLGPFWDEVLYEAGLDLDVSFLGSQLLNFDPGKGLSFSVNNLYGKLKYYDVPLVKGGGKLLWTGDTVFVEQVGVQMGKNDLLLHGYVCGNGKLDTLKVFCDVTSNMLDFKELLVYKGVSWVHQEIEQHVQKEQLKDFGFHIDALLKKNTSLTSDWYGFLNLEGIKGVWNDFLPVYNSKLSGVIDSTGTLSLSHVSFNYGKSDLNGYFKVYNLFSKAPNQSVHLKGHVFSNLLDWDEISNNYKVSSNHPSAKVQTQTVNHDSGLNWFVLPFPVTDLTCNLGHFKFNKYRVKAFYLGLRTSKSHYIYLDTLSFYAASGKVKVKGYFNGSNPDSLYSKLSFNLEDINLNEVLYKLDNFGQDYVIQENIQGIINASIDGFFKMHRDLTIDLSDAAAEIDLHVRDGVLSHFKPLMAMSDFLGNKNLNSVRFGDLKNTLSFRNGKIFIPDMQISSSVGYLFLKGYHSPDTMNYELDLPLSLVRQAGWGMVKSKLGTGRGRVASAKELEEVESEIISTQKGVFKRYLGFYLVGNEHDFDIRIGKLRRIRE